MSPDPGVWAAGERQIVLGGLCCPTTASVLGKLTIRRMLGAAVGESLLKLETPDGRELAFALWGDRDGYPVLMLHGTPGCRLERWPDEDLYRRLGVLVVTHDRPGYGRSTRRPGRRIVDEVDDVVALADHLGLEQFGVTGGSGGGSHALACAALLPDRVVRATCQVGVAPLGNPGLDQESWLAGMDPENVKEFGWAVAGEEVLIPELEAEHERITARVAVDPSAVLDAFELSDSDREELARRERVQIIRESWAEHSALGVEGWADDDLAHIRPWGFDLDRISIPVLVWYGATDVLVPPAHGEWLAANVPGCVVKVDGVAGHLGTDPREAITENARWLREGVPPAHSS
jgi:pimeloyl-ACP methyl ester carboxylesterase